MTIREPWVDNYKSMNLDQLIDEVDRVEKCGSLYAPTERLERLAMLAQELALKNRRAS